MAIFTNRKKELEQIEQEKQNIERKKEELRSREEQIRDAERIRDAGFSDKTREFDLAFETARQAKEKELSDYENSERQRIADLLQKERKEKISVLLADYGQKKQEYDSLIKSQNEAFEKQKLDAENAINSLRETAKTDLEQELARQKEEYEKFFDLQKEELEKYKKLKAQECDEYISAKKQWIDAEITKSEAQIKEDYDKFRAKLTEEDGNFNVEMQIKRETQDAEFEQRRKDFENKIKQERDDFEAFKDVENKKLNTRESELYKLKSELDLQTRQIERQAEANATNESRLSDEIESRTAECKRLYEEETARLKDDNAQLLSSIETANRTITIFEELKAKLGGEDPAAVLKQLNDYELQIQSLRQELTERPSKEIEDRFNEFKENSDRLQAQKDKLEDEVLLMKETVDETDSIRRENTKLSEDNKLLSETKTNLEAHNNELQAELNRLQASYKNDSEREERIKDIKAPYFAEAKQRLPELILKDKKDEDKKQEIKQSEIDWLNGIENKIKIAEFKIPQRILYAFHTALKTAEWSPITVLAGVSGTGKSELPRLYSHFGGVNFLNIAVQPNWDSQESMLGFFNSIDNKFDANPVLRLLAQSQEPKTADYPGLEDTMNLILLDEMNLAHIELYFAEFLSKLELRRGMKKGDVPAVAVKLGSGMTPFDLKLGRNVLWCGTMNQDETTKSLSDKVLDRGIIINFPRPTELQRRKKLTAIGDPSDLLPKSTWSQWVKKESLLNDEETNQYKGFIEEMNGHLSKAGRALGHRVWQSIEYYMSNYPIIGDSREKTLRTAFEDQLVQKVMPKLRGIETRGKTKAECLDKIRKQIADNGYNIVDDFDFACEFGYGQFIWNSANYLKEEVQTIETTESKANE